MPPSINNKQKQELIILGNKIREIRHEKCMSLEDVACKIDKNRQSLQRLEKGDFNPSYIFLLEVCKGLDIDIKQLF